MSTAYFPDNISEAAYKFMAENPTADILAAKRYAQKNFPDREEQRRFIKAFFDGTVKQNELASDADRIWSDRKRY